MIPSFGNEGDRKGGKGNENGKETRGGKGEAEEKTWKGREEVRKECWEWSLREGKGREKVRKWELKGGIWERQGNEERVGKRRRSKEITVSRPG